MPPPSDPRNLRAKWQRALEERRKAGNAEPPVDVTPRAAKPKTPEKEAAEQTEEPSVGKIDPPSPSTEAQPQPQKTSAEGSSNEKDEPKKKANAPASSVWSSIGAAVVLVGGVGFALRTFITEASPSGVEEDPPVPSVAPVEPPLNVSADPTAKPAPKARCPAPTDAAFVIGDAPAPKTAASADGEDSHEDELQPFAVEVGRGVVTPDGFAIGAQRPGEGGTISMVATLDANGKNGRLVRLARSRGDFDPPVVAAAGNAILAAMMEPHASGRSIRTAKVEGDRVTWGPELSESNDESTAVDIASQGSRAVIVWDDVPLGRERSVIELATFDVYTMAGGGARPVTPPSLDADVPHIVKRPGGYWLSYLAHGEPPTEPTALKNDDPDAGTKPGKSKGSDNPDDSDTEAAGEAIAHQWIELVPLDESGFAMGAPRAVTPKTARVIGYDLQGRDDGSAVLLYREDDTPSGSTGGRVELVTVELGGVSDPKLIAEEGLGTGVPLLYGDWVVIHSLAGPVRVGLLGPKGDLTSDLAPETALRLGEILGGNNERFLVGTPAGRAMKLAVVQCARQ